MNEQKPSIGRIVHYVDPAKQMQGIKERHLPAIITEVNDDGTLELTVFRPRMDSFNAGGIKQDEITKKTYTWHWCERE